MSVEVTIDGKKLTGRPDQTILEVAQENGIHIPTLCTHPKLKPTGACRVCVVDIGRKDRLEAACTTPISKGMTVETANDRVLESRRVVVELLLENLPVDASDLGKDGENVLLDLAEELEIKPHMRRLLSKPKPKKPTDARNPVIVREPDKCILCGRCVSACNELRRYGVLNFEGRGYHMNIVSGVEQALLESGCASCGECAEVCPTGAFRPLARELVQDEIDNVIKTGTIYPASSITHSTRSRLGLPPLEETDASDLVIIAEKTRRRVCAEEGEAR
ncbi:MAG: 2Fe-2S iron-sulfur cluster-binding protein [Candidatus Bathyarchaeota archaeon]